MAEEQWQYEMMVRPFSELPDSGRAIPGRMATDLGNVAIEAMREVTDTFANRLRGSAVDGPVEIVSHAFVTVGPTLLLTILYRYKG